MVTEQEQAALEKQLLQGIKPKMDKLKRVKKEAMEAARAATVDKRILALLKAIRDELEMDEVMRDKLAVRAPHASLNLDTWAAACPAAHDEKANFLILLGWWWA
jgi:hypothetical protein